MWSAQGSEFNLCKQYAIFRCVRESYFDERNVEHRGHSAMSRHQFLAQGLICLLGYGSLKNIDRFFLNCPLFTQESSAHCPKCIASVTSCLGMDSVVIVCIFETWMNNYGQKFGQRGWSRDQVLIPQVFHKLPNSAYQTSQKNVHAYGRWENTRNYF